ncbi:hypothetical protein KKH23_04770 [Patescibacteria group bacterium]|nr:hypothetical protein [Patescibacteria group bacterium]
MEEYTLKIWLEEAIRRFGPDPLNWNFVCPTCGHVQCGEDFAKINPPLAKDPKNIAYQECIGRYDKKAGGCDFVAYGLISSDIVVIAPCGEVHVFPFAEET